MPKSKPAQNTVEDWENIPCNVEGCKGRVACKTTTGKYLCVDHTPRQPKHPFDYHSPSKVQIDQIASVRTKCKELHETLLTLPPNRERSLAITNLEQVSMWANKGIIMADEGPVAK